MTQVAVLNGSNGFRRAQCAALQTPPFWFCGGASITEVNGGAAMTFFAAAKTDMSMGSWLKTFYPRPSVYVADGSGNSSATGTEAIIPRPYWDFIGATVVSATGREVWLNGTEDLGGTVTGGTSRVIGDISAGETRIGIDCAGANGVTGRLGRWLAGTGAPTDADKALLKAFDGVTLPTLSGGVTITNGWLLDGNGNDFVGGEHMSNVGTPAYATDAMASPTPVTTRSQLIAEIHTTNGAVYTDMPTFTADVTPPVDTSGFTNLAHVHALDAALLFGALPFKGRVHLFVPQSPSRQTVLCNFGHQNAADMAADTYGAKTAFKDLVAAGHMVAVGYMIGLDTTTFNTFNNSSLGITTSDHNSFSFLQDSTHNPWELLVGPLECALNYIKANYASYCSKVSFLGFSGGSDVGTIMMAVDPRIDFAGIFFRGSIAARRRVDTNMDYEQYPNATNWDQNQFHRFCSVGSRHLWLVFHPGDGIIGSNSYISKSSYEDKFMAPMLAANPLSDPQVKISTGSSGHALYQADLDDTILPLLATAVIPPLGGLPFFAGGGSYL